MKELNNQVYKLNVPKNLRNIEINLNVFQVHITGIIFSI